MDNSVDRFTKGKFDSILVELIVPDGVAVILNAVIIFISISIAITLGEWRGTLLIISQH